MSDGDAFETLATAIAAVATVGDVAATAPPTDEATHTQARVASTSAVLFDAVRIGSPTIVQMLLSMGANPSARQEAGGRTPLHYAVFYGRADVAKLLLDAGANANSADAGGTTPLMEAAAMLQPEVVRLLVAPPYLADTNAMDAAGNTALHLAARQARSASTVSTLIRARADPRVRNCAGKTAIEVMAPPSSVYHDADTLGLLRQAAGMWSGLPTTALAGPRGSLSVRWYGDAPPADATAPMAMATHGATAAPAGAGATNGAEAAPALVATVSAAPPHVEEAVSAAGARPGSPERRGRRSAPATAAAAAAVGAGAAGAKFLATERARVAERDERAAKRGGGDEACVVCLTGERVVAFAPCGHLCACLACNATLMSRGDRCPMCRAQIRAWLRIYRC